MSCQVNVHTVTTFLCVLSHRLFLSINLRVPRCLGDRNGAQRTSLSTAGGDRKCPREQCGKNIGHFRRLLNSMYKLNSSYINLKEAITFLGYYFICFYISMFKNVLNKLLESD